jgi:hypothetical protein
MKIPTQRPGPSTPEVDESGDESDLAKRTPATGHEDWLLDESLDETFPASDPISPARARPSKAGPPRAQ